MAIVAPRLAVAAHEMPALATPGGSRVARSFEARACGRRVAWGDRGRLGQVLRSLLSNAINYSPAADRIVIRLGMLANMLYIHIQDFGIGMTREMQEKIHAMK